MKVEKVYLEEALTQDQISYFQGKISGYNLGDKLINQEVKKVKDDFKNVDVSNVSDSAIKRELDTRADKIKERNTESKNKSHLDKLYNDTFTRASAGNILQELHKHWTEGLGQLNHYLTNNLKNFRAPFLTKFLDAITKEELNNPNSVVLNVFNTKQAGNVLIGKTYFDNFYNLLINKYLKYTKDYINEPDAIIYNPYLYSKVKDEEDRVKLVDLDLEGKIDRAELNNAIKKGEYTNYIGNSLDAKNKKDVNDLKDDFNSLLSSLRQAGVSEADLRNMLNSFINGNNN